MNSKMKLKSRTMAVDFCGILESSERTLKLIGEESSPYNHQHEDPSAYPDTISKGFLHREKYPPGRL
jgi:hypothetical protein